MQHLCATSFTRFANASK